MTAPVLLHRVWAAVCGYFWLPCPLCGRYFGGHQWRRYDGKPDSIPTERPGIGRAICPSCTKAGYGVGRY